MSEEGWKDPSSETPRNKIQAGPTHIFDIFFIDFKDFKGFQKF